MYNKEDKIIIKWIYYKVWNKYGMILLNYQQ